MSREQKQRGLVLVTVLWVVVLLMIMGASVGRTSRLHTKMAHYQAQSLRCQWGARAGVETALAILKEDVTSTDSLSDLYQVCVFSSRIFLSPSTRSVSFL